MRAVRRAKAENQKGLGEQNEAGTKQGARSLISLVVGNSARWVGNGECTSNGGKKYLL